MSTTKTPALDLSRSTDRAFVHLLVNTLLVSVINFTVWFAVTFWVFLETESVLATGMVAGIFLVATALSGIWFGSLVDHYRKKTVMQASSLVSLAFYAVAFTLYQLTAEQTFTNPASVMLWVFIVLSMFGVIAGNIRSIALMTLVTLLIPEDRRDRANGLVGTTMGVSFLVTSVISGLLVAAGGMFYVLLLGMAVLGLSVVHLAFVRVEERPEAAASPDAESTDPQPKQSKVDLRGTLRVARRAGSAGLDRLLLLQQLPSRCVHGPDGRVRAVSDVGAGVGSAVGCPQYLLHPRWPRRRQDWAEQESSSAAAAGQHRILERDLPVPAAGLGDLAGGGYGRLHAVGPVRRSGRTDHPSEGCALRAARPGLWVRPKCGAGRRR